MPGSVSISYQLAHRIRSYTQAVLEVDVIECSTILRNGEIFQCVGNQSRIHAILAEHCYEIVTSFQHLKTPIVRPA